MRAFFRNLKRRRTRIEFSFSEFPEAGWHQSSTGPYPYYFNRGIVKRLEKLEPGTAYRIVDV